MTSETTSGQDSDLVKHVIEPLYRARNWMKFLAVLALLGGALNILSIIGILFAWIPIAAGVMLLQSASAVDQAYRSGTAYDARRGLDKLKSLFMFYGILTLVGLAIVAFAIAVGAGNALMESAREMR